MAFPRTTSSLVQMTNSQILFGPKCHELLRARVARGCGVDTAYSGLRQMLYAIVLWKNMDYDRWDSFILTYILSSTVT